MNHIVLIGRLTKDPELRYTPNGVAVANFSLAVDRDFVNQAGERETDFIPVVAWQKLAETCANYLRKGRLTAVQGRLQVRSYESQEGQRRWISEVVASNVQFLEWAENRQPAGPGVSKPDASGAESDDDIGEINLDDLPF